MLGRCGKHSPTFPSLLLLKVESSSLNTTADVPVTYYKRPEPEADDDDDDDGLLA